MQVTTGGEACLLVRKAAVYVQLLLLQSIACANFDYIGINAEAANVVRGLLASKECQMPVTSHESDIPRSWPALEGVVWFLSETEVLTLVEDASLTFA